jgi:hypothetical protein
MCHKQLDKIQLYSQNWKKLNPEYEIQCYDDAMCRDFLMKEYGPLFVNIFNFIPDGPIKADFWRVCIINKYGGLYVDADIKPLVPLREYIEDDDDFCTCISHCFNERDPRKTRWNPHFILSNKNNPILQKCILKYVYLYTNRIKYNYDVWGIPRIMDIKGVTRKRSQILYINGLKCKFLLEEASLNDCSYNGKVVFKNRYDEYRNHQFINSNSNINITNSNILKHKYYLYKYLMSLRMKKYSSLFQFGMKRKLLR